MHRQCIFCTILPHCSPSRAGWHGNWYHNSCSHAENWQKSWSFGSHATRIALVCTHDAHNVRPHTPTHTHMRTHVRVRAGAMRGYVDTVYTEIHRLGKFSVNHSSNWQCIYAQVMCNCTKNRQIGVSGTMISKKVVPVILWGLTSALDSGIIMYN